MLPTLRARVRDAFAAPAHVREVKLYGLLSQLHRALALSRPKDVVSEAPLPRPIIIINHLHVPMDSSAEPAPAQMIAMTLTFQRFLSDVMEDDLADVLVLSHNSQPVALANAAAWRVQRKAGPVARARVADAEAFAFTQAEAVDEWLEHARS